MKKSDIIDSISKSTGLTKKDVENVLHGVFDAISEAVSNGEKVSLPGFGSFDISHRQARMGRNPRTGEAIEIAASKSVRFSVAKQLKDLVNKG